MKRPQAASRDETGFTVIELMLVVLIISILVAIAIPTFNGARRAAQDREAQSTLRSGLIAQKTFFIDSQTFADDGDPADLAVLQEIESSIVWDTLDASTHAVDVYALTTFVVNDDGVGLRSASRSGRVFCLADVARNVPDGGTWFANVPAAGTCPDVASGMAGWVKDPATGWQY